MLQSYVIDIDGVFVGAATRLDRGYRFLAIDVCPGEVDSTLWPTLADVRRTACRVYRTGCFVDLPITGESS
jgi:hypothetical protein